MSLRLPLAHVDWLAEQPRTCHEYFLLIASQTNRPNDPVNQNSLLLAIEWTLAASQPSNTDPTNSCLVLTMECLQKSTKAFDKWQQDTLNCTLGRECISSRPAESGGASAAPTLDFYANLIASQAKLSALQTVILQQMASGGTQAAGQKTSSKGRVYDLHDQAAIMGWCGVKNIAHVPRIWGM